MTKKAEGRYWFLRELPTRKGQAYQMKITGSHCFGSDPTDKTQKINMESLMLKFNITRLKLACAWPFSDKA